MPRAEAMPQPVTVVIVNLEGRGHFKIWQVQASYLAKQIVSLLISHSTEPTPQKVHTHK